MLTLRLIFLMLLWIPSAYAHQASTRLSNGGHR